MLTFLLRLSMACRIQPAFRRDCVVDAKPPTEVGAESNLLPYCCRLRLDRRYAGKLISASGVENVLDSRPGCIRITAIGRIASAICQGDYIRPVPASH